MVGRTAEGRTYTIGRASGRARAVIRRAERMNVYGVIGLNSELRGTHARAKASLGKRRRRRESNGSRREGGREGVREGLPSYCIALLLLLLLLSFKNRSRRRRRRRRRHAPPTEAVTNHKSPPARSPAHTHARSESRPVPHAFLPSFLPSFLPRSVFFCRAAGCYSR